MESAVLIGLPSAGTSTVFDALTGGAGHAGGKSEVRRGDIKVPDPRIDHLSRVFHPRKTTYADLVCVDAGGFEPDGKRLDGQRKNVLQSADALVPVIRAFPEFGQPEPVRDLSHILETLLLSDLVVVEQRLERLRKQAARGPESDLLQRFLAAIEEGKPLGALHPGAHELALVSGYSLLSLKAVIVVLNVGEAGVDKRVLEHIDALLAPWGGKRLMVNAAMEKEVAELPPDEQGAFLRELGVECSARDALLQAVYAAMDLIPFFTVGPDEVRAWTIRRGTTAVHAAGKIHSDLERGFIRAEVIAYDDFVACGNSQSVARERGLLRVEGKDYVVADGDILNIRFSV